MTIKRILAIIFIYICCVVAWFLLGSSLVYRTMTYDSHLGRTVAGVWGPQLVQPQITAYYKSPASPNGKRILSPAKSRIHVNLQSKPRRKGLLWYRTYEVEFDATYEFENPTPISQTLYVSFPLPAENAEYQNFRFEIPGATGEPGGSTAELVRAVHLAAGERKQVSAGYTAAGMETWRYVLGEAKQTRDFELIMTTDFREINFPEGTSSTTAPWSPSAKGYDLTWSYPEIRGLQAIGMDMPSVVNPGPIAARITFFAPVSLLFYFTVLFLISIVRGMGLHPMNFFFLGAGCFAFQLLFAYLVDVIDVFVAFGIAALVSMILVSGYVWLVAGPRVGWPAAIAQFGYMILFSASFFIEGLTGLIITCGAIVTLAILMIATAKVNWMLVFPSKRRAPPPLTVPA